MAEPALSKLKVAIVCDWLTTVGGAERVVKSLHQMFPSAPIYTSQYNPQAIDWFKGADIRTGWLNKLPRTMHKFFPLLRGWYFSGLRFDDYDVVISSTGAEAKAIKTSPKTLHISYMHAPTQYYWSLYDDYVAQPGFGWLDPVIRLVLKIFIQPLRRLDKKFAARPDLIVSNSHYVQQEIKKYYGRESVVIFPPVSVEHFSNVRSKKRQGFIVTSRQVPWKRLDLAVSACVELGEKLTVVGDGSEHAKLVALAQKQPTISFLPTKNTEELAALLSASEGFIFPSLEPFGIAPVEALATGTPVIAYGAGGALDYVQHEVNGILFNAQTKTSLIAAIQQFRQVKFDEVTTRRSAEAFSERQFVSQMRELIQTSWQERS